LRFGKSIHELSELNLNKRNVELEVNLGWGDGKGAARVIERVFHGSGILVLFAFEEPYPAKAGEDLRIGGAVFVKSSFVL